MSDGHLVQTEQARAEVGLRSVNEKASQGERESDGYCSRPTPIHSPVAQDTDRRPRLQRFLNLQQQYTGLFGSATHRRTG